MVIENLGIKTDKFYVSPFVLKEGEVIIIKLANNNFLSETENCLKDFLSGKRDSLEIKIFKHLTVVEHIKETYFQNHFYPLTVGRYLMKKGNSKNPISQKIYEIEWVNKKTKVRELPGNPRKLLSIYTTFSKTNNIVFDLFGQDSQGRKETFNFVKENIRNGGSAILIDCFDDFENECTKCIELEYYES